MLASLHAGCDRRYRLGSAALLRDRTDTQASPRVLSGQKPPPDPGMIPLTIPEIKRLLTASGARPHPPGHAAHWLHWRRRHQARSCWYHKRTRLSRDTSIPLVS
jgi:hypothetical protein